jgi:hypothetical protein
LRFVIRPSSTTWQRPARKIINLLLAGLILTACGGPGLSEESSEPTATVAASPPPDKSPATPEAAQITCGDGHLLIRDLAAMNQRLQDGLQQATARATEWQEDAQLTSLRVGCELLEPGFRWQATFYSPSAQTFYESDTGRVEAAEDDPAEVPELATSGLSFSVLRRALNAEGYDDSTELDPSTGVEVRQRTPTRPFGPPEGPKAATLFHVAVLFRGEVKDLFVDASDGKVYRYTFE